MTTEWRRIGWQQMQAVVPANWYLSKISTDRASGELWLADEVLPRLQIKWLDASRQKAVNPTETLDRYLQQLEKQSKKRRLAFAVERDIRLIHKAGRDISSVECFRWTAEMQAYGVIWYSRAAERVTLAQVNGELDEQDFKELAKGVLTSLKDASDEATDLWTAYDLECRLPPEWQLLGQRMETGRTELKFGRAKDLLTITRFGLASIALQRAGDLGDWAHSERYKEWVTFRLERDETAWQGYPAVTFRGPKRSWAERARQRTYNFLGLPYPAQLAARVWHVAEANCLYLVEHLHDRRSAALLEPTCLTIPPRPQLLSGPRS